MKHTVICIVAMSLLCSASLAWSADVQEKLNQLTAEVEKLPPVIPADISGEEKAKLESEFEILRSFIKEKLIPLTHNKVWVDEITKQNAQKVSLDEIKAIDKQWTEAEEELPIHVEKMSNPCAKEIVKTNKSINALGEVFVMDNQGANVGQNALTSDYWQGDEAKWKNSFKDGKGGVDVSQRKYDRSSGVVDQKVSLPVINEQGEVIGAVCFGINIGQLATMVASN